MRILTVGNLYPPHHFGGYEQVWESAVRHLRDRGHELRVLATDYRHPGVPDDEQPGVHRVLRWYWRDHDFTRPPYRERVRMERHNRDQLERQLSELRPEVVAFWSMGGMSHSLIEVARRSGLPVVAFVHDGWLDYGRFTDQWMQMFISPVTRLLRPFAQLLTGLPTRVRYEELKCVFVSDFERRRALALPSAPRDTAVAHSGIDPAFIVAPAEREWQWRLLNVGRLHPDKGIHDVVAAMPLLPEAATVTFAGSWDQRDESALERQVAELGLGERVSMLGQQPRSEIARLYREHDALLFPVRWEEPWGLVPLEAMGSGCPVVATGRGGSAEYLRDEHNCLLVPPSDPPALARAVRRLGAEHALRQRLREGGSETAPRHIEPIFNAQVERELRAAIVARG